MSKSSNKKKSTTAASSIRKDSVTSSNDQQGEVPANYGKIAKYCNVRYGIASAISLITFIVYLSTLHNEFVLWDDDRYVYENPHIHSLSPAFFKWAFSEFYVVGNWHPLTWVSHALDYAVWGLNPLGHHLTNNILHAVNTFVVVILATTLLEAWKTKAEKGPQFFLNRQTILIAGGITGLLFGLHPLHVESAAWVSERKDLLCALFYLLAIVQYIKYANVRDAETMQDNSRTRFLNKYYLFVLAFFILALLSKPMAVSLPVVLLILDWYPFERIRSIKSFLPVFIEKLPLIVLSIISSILTVLAQKGAGAMQYTDIVPFSSRISVAAKALLVYLWKMALPVNLVPFYPYPANISLFSADYLLSVILVLGITAACIVIAKRHKLWLSVWGYYVITLLPVLGIVRVGNQSMADRYAYLPSLGPLLMAGLLSAWVIEKTNIRQKRVLIVGVAAVLVSVCLSFLTVKQVAIWKDSLTLWSYVIEKEPNVHIAHYNLGLIYQNQNMLDKAEQEYITAIKLEPNSELPYNNLGLVYESLNMPDKAVELYLAAIKLNPDNAEAHNNLGGIYRDRNMSDKAVEQYLTAIKLNPDYAEAHNSLGLVYKSLNMPDKAVEQYLTAIKVRPDYAEAHNNLGGMYLIYHMPDKAKDEFLTAIRLKPSFAEAHFNLGLAYYKNGQTENALTELSRGLEIKPTDQHAQQLLKIITARLKTKD